MGGVERERESVRAADIVSNVSLVDISGHVAHVTVVPYLQHNWLGNTYK